MLDAAHGVGIRTVPSIQRVDVARSEVQVACADTAGGSGRRRPVVALGADAAQSTRLTVAVTRSRGFITIAGLNVPEEFGSSGTDWDAELACEPPPADCGIYPTALTEAVASVTPGPGEPFVGEFCRFGRVGNSFADAGRSAQKDRTPGTCSTAGSRRPRRSAGSPRRYCRTQKSTSTRRRPRRRRPSRLRRHGGGSPQQ